MSIKLILQFNVRNDKQADFSDIMCNVKTELPEVEGCLSVEIHHNTEDVTNYMVVEKWASEELHKKHVEELVTSGSWDHIVSHLSEAPTSGYYNVM